MNLLLMRHGEALPIGQGSALDMERTLSTRGQEEVRKAAAGLRSLGHPVDLILASPFRRTMDTARLMGEAFPGTRVLASPHLQPTGTVIDILGALSAYLHLNDVVLIGHNPDVTMSISALSGNNRQFGIPTGCVAAFDWQPRSAAQLLWIRGPGDWPASGEARPRRPAS